MVQRTYYDDGTPTEPLWGRDDTPSRPGTVLRHGVTLEDLERAARLAQNRSIGAAMMFSAERYDIAFSGAAAALYEAESPPTLVDLINAGTTAIGRAASAELHHHGKDNTRHIGQEWPRYVAYWTPGAKTPLEDWVVERHALSQVWKHLKPAEQEALAALAVHGTADAAAKAMGKKHRVTYKHIRDGRQRALALWLEGETPPPPPIDKRVKSYSPPPQECFRGHPWDEENTVWHRSGRSRRRVCRQCRQIRRGGGA